MQANSQILIQLVRHNNTNEPSKKRVKNTLIAIRKDNRSNTNATGISVQLRKEKIRFW